jgi:DNA-binding MarR family transcriptional regulator
MKSDPSDRRKKSLGLTASGSVVAEKLRPIAQEVRTAVEAGFSSAEKDALRRFLIRVMANMEDLESARETRGVTAGARQL